MRWVVMLPLVYLFAATQAGIGDALAVRVGSVRAVPDLLLTLAVFATLAALREAALLTCLASGVAADMISPLPFGTFTFAYGVGGWVATSLGREVAKRHPLTHVLVTLATMASVAASVWLVGRVRREPTGLSAADWLGVALYTAAIAPWVIAVLWRVRWALVRSPYRD